MSYQEVPKEFSDKHIFIFVLPISYDDISEDFRGFESCNLAAVIAKCFHLQYKLVQNKCSSNKLTLPLMMTLKNISEGLKVEIWQL